MDHHGRSWTVIPHPEKRKAERSQSSLSCVVELGYCSPTPVLVVGSPESPIWEQDGSNRPRSSALRCGQRDSLQCSDQGRYL